MSVASNKSCTHSVSESIYSDTDTHTSSEIHQDESERLSLLQAQIDCEEMQVGINVLEYKAGDHKSKHDDEIMMLKNERIGFWLAVMRFDLAEKLKKNQLVYVISLIFAFLLIFFGATLLFWNEHCYNMEQQSIEKIKSQMIKAPNNPSGANDNKLLFFTRSIAEFDKMKGVLIRYPFGIPMQIMIEILNDVNMTIYCLISSKYTNIIDNIFPESVDMDKIQFIISETDSYWTRDYGPFFVHSYSNNMQLNQSSNNIGVAGFKYNRPRPNDNAIAYKLSLYFNLTYFNISEIQNTGGNYMTDGCDFAAATHITYTENHKYCNMSNQTLTNLSDPKLPSCAYVNNVMKRLLGIEHFAVFQDPNKDYINHIDCWSKFLSENKILIKKFTETDHRYNEMEMIVEYWQNTMNSFNQKWEIYRVYSPNDEPYTNSFILNNKVFVPLIDDENSFVHNENAMKVYENALPNYKIIGFYSSGSIGWLSTDAIHCRLKGVPDFDYILQRTHDLCEYDGGSAKSSGFQWNSWYVYIVASVIGVALIGVALIGFIVWFGFKAVVGSNKQKMKEETKNDEWDEIKEYENLLCEECYKVEEDKKDDTLLFQRVNC